MPDTPRTPSEDQLVKDTRIAVIVALFIKRHWAIGTALVCFLWGGAQWVKGRVLADAQKNATSADQIIMGKVDEVGSKVDRNAVKTDTVIDLLRTHITANNGVAKSTP